MSMFAVWVLLLSLAGDICGALKAKEIPSAPQAIVAKPVIPPALIPHRAHYKITLNRPAKQTNDSDLEQLTGFANIEVQKVPGGYIRNVTFVIYAYPNDAPMQTIMRSFATFESEDGQNYTFRVNTRNELGEEISIKGEGLAPPQLLGIVRYDVDTPHEEAEEEEQRFEEDELNNLDPIHSRFDLPAGTLFPVHLLLRMMTMVNTNLQSSNVVVYDPYWSSVHKVDLAVVPSKINTQFNLGEGVSEQVKKQLEGQPVQSVICGFYGVGIQEGNKTDAADEPLHQMQISLLPCGVITELVLEDPSVGEPIKLTLSRVELFG